MNSKYHTNDGRSQSAGTHLRRGRKPSMRVSACPGSRQFITNSSNQSIRIPIAVTPAAPLLVGNREMLRRLRAAEMAAWEAARPNNATAHEPRLSLDESTTRVHECGEHSRLPMGLLLLVAACASVALSLDLLDVSLLLTGWSQLVSGLRSLFA